MKAAILVVSIIMLPNVQSKLTILNPQSIKDNFSYNGTKGKVTF